MSIPSHQKHGSAPFPRLAFRKEGVLVQVPLRFRSRKPDGQVPSAQPVDSDSEDDFVAPTPAMVASRQKQADKAIALENKQKAEKEEKKANARKKKEEKEAEKGNKPQKKRQKKVEKPNITEDTAARQGLTFRAERAVVNQTVKWVWGEVGLKQILISDAYSRQPLPEMDEDRIALQFFDTPRRLQLFVI